ncbi:purine-cytosine permease family protein [Paradesulfitobacterium aromaticivorans]
MLPGKYALPAILLGNALPVFLITPLSQYFSRYGIDTFIGARSALGYLGSDIFYFIFALLNLGWITVACFMLGESAIKVAGAFGAPEFLTTRTSGAPIFAIIAFLLSFYIAYKGPVAIKWFNRIGVPAILVILVGLIVIVLFREGIAKVWDATPISPYDSTQRGIVTAIEWNAGLGFSWLPYIGQWSRLVKSEKQAHYGSLYGFGIVLNVAAIFGAFTALLVSSMDPTDWMIKIGGVSWGLLGLFLLILANITSAITLLYSQALSFKSIFPRQKWINALLTTVPAALLMLSPYFYDAYSKFLSAVSFIMAAYGGVLIADYFFFRKKKVSMVDLYDRGGKYRFWRGINPASVVAVVGSYLFYVWTYNPLADVAGPLFGYLSAGIPTFFVAGFIYLIFSNVVFKSVCVTTTVADTISSAR